MSKTVFFGNASAYSARTSPSLLQSGEIGIYSVAATGGYTLLTTTPTSAQKQLPIMIAQGGVTGGNFKSLMIYPGGIVSAPTAATAYTTPVPNVDIVGYTGISGDTTTIIANAAGTYNLTATNTSKTAPPLPFNFASLFYATAATPAAVALDWARAINSKTLNLSLQPYDRFVMAQVLLSTVAGGGTPGAETAITTNGSAIVTTSATLSTNYVAGSYIRFGAAGTANNLLTPVYKIASIDSTTQLTLTAPFVDPSLALGATTTFTGSATSASSQITYIAAASVSSATLAGIRLTSFGNWFNGSAFKELYPNYSIAVGVSGLAVGTPIIHNGVTAQSYSTGVTISSGVSKVGYGVGWQAQKQEYEAQGYQGNTNRSWLPYPVQYFASATSNYDGYAFNFRSYPTSGGANDGNYKSELHECVIFCVNAGTAGTVATNALVTASIPTIISGYSYI
jgi:hypothetical protein